MLSLNDACGCACTLSDADTVNAFFPCAFLLFCNSEDNSTILALLSLLNLLLNGVQVLTDDITSLAKSRTDSRGAALFGPAFVGALRRTQRIAHRIEAPVVVPRRDGKASRAEYRDLFRGLDVASRGLFAATMTTFIADATVKLPVVVDDVYDTVIDKSLAYLPLCASTRSSNISAAKTSAAAMRHAQAKRRRRHGRRPRRSRHGHSGRSPSSYLNKRASPCPFQQEIPVSLKPSPRPPVPTPSVDLTVVYLSNVEAVVAQMVQENAPILACHAGTTAADRCARMREKKFTALRQSLKGAFNVFVMPDRPRKRLRDSPEGPPCESTRLLLRGSRPKMSARTTRAHRATSICASPRRAPRKMRSATSYARSKMPPNASSIAIMAMA